MGFTAVTPDQLAQVLADPDCLSEIEQQPIRIGVCGQELVCDLEKMWDGLAFLLGSAEVPVDLEIYMHDVVDNGDADTAGWSVDEVREAANHLGATPFEWLASHFDPSEMTRLGIYPRIWDRDDHALDDLRETYEDMVRFFDAAARAGAAVVQTQR